MGLHVNMCKPLGMNGAKYGTVFHANPRYLTKGRLGGGSTKSPCGRISNSHSLGVLFKWLSTRKNVHFRQIFLKDNHYKTSKEPVRIEYSSMMVTVKNVFNDASCRLHSNHPTNTPGKNLYLLTWGVLVYVSQLEWLRRAIITRTKNILFFWQFLRW